MAPDVVDANTRSRMMAGIRGKNTKPEILIRSALHRKGFRFRIHQKCLPGKPDIVLPKYGAVVQVHGCFWHYHNCHLFKFPSTRLEWWKAKLLKTRETDFKNQSELVADGWKLAVVWECALKGKTRLDFDSLLQDLADWIADPNSAEYLELAGTESIQPGLH